MRAKIIFLKDGFNGFGYKVFRADIFLQTIQRRMA